jgi:hypothetical protein
LQLDFIGNECNYWNGQIAPMTSSQRQGSLLAVNDPSRL